MVVVVVWCGVVWCGGVGVWRRRRGRRLRTLSRPRYVSNDDIYTQQASETRESVQRIISQSSSRTPPILTID